MFPSDLHIPRISLPILLAPKRQTDPGNIKIAHRHINLRIGNEGTQFHLWDFINWLFNTGWGEQERMPLSQIGLDSIKKGPYKYPRALLKSCDRFVNIRAMLIIIVQFRVALWLTEKQQLATTVEQHRVT